MDFEMKSLEITKFTAQDLPAVSNFIAGLNQQPEHHIVYFGTTHEEVAHYLVEEQTIPAEESYLKARYCGKLVGVIGLEYDLELRRAWIEGPLVRGEYWDEIAAELHCQPGVVRYAFSQRIYEFLRHLTSRPIHKRFIAFQALLEYGILEYVPVTEIVAEEE